MPIRPSHCLLLGALMVACTTPYKIRGLAIKADAPVCLKEVRFTASQTGYGRKGAEPCAPQCAGVLDRALRNAWCPEGSPAARYPLTLDIEASSNLFADSFTWSLYAWLLTAFTFPAYDGMQGEYTVKLRRGDDLLATWSAQIDDVVFISGGFPFFGALTMRSPEEYAKLQDTLVLQHVVDEVERRWPELRQLYAEADRRANPPAPQMAPASVAAALRAHDVVAPAKVAPGDAKLREARSAMADGDLEGALRRIVEARALLSGDAALAQAYLLEARCLDGAKNKDLVLIEKALARALEHDPEAKLDPEKVSPMLVTTLNGLRDRRLRRDSKPAVPK